MREYIGMVSYKVGSGTTKATGVLVGMIAQAVFISQFVDHNKEVTPKYVASSLVYMHMAAFLALVIQKYIAAVGKKCEIYYLMQKP